MPYAPRQLPAMAKLRVHLASDAAEPGYYSLDRARFEAAGREFPDTFRRLAPSYSAGDEEEFVRGVADAEVLIGWKFPRADLANRAPHLKWIQLIGAGVDHLQPFDWLPPGAQLTNASGVHTEKSFEYTLMALVALFTRLPRLLEQQRQRKWSKIQTGTLPGRTALVIGMGAVGTGAARAAEALGMRVLGVRRSRRPHRYADRVVPFTELPSALPHADFVVLAAPLTAETRELLGAAEIARLPRGAGIVNLGRGRLIAQPALTAALRSGQLGGAFLDVAWPEPHPPDGPLWDAPNLILTPHVGADDIENYVPLVFRIALENLTRHLAGKRLRNRVRFDLGY